MNDAEKNLTHPKQHRNFVAGSVRINLKLLIMRLFVPYAEKNLNHIREVKFFVAENVTEFLGKKIKQKYVLCVELIFNENIMNKYIVVVVVQTKVRFILCESIQFLEMSPNPINVFENY